VRRIAPNGFAIPFSLAGLGGLWLTAADAGRAPRAVGEALFLVAAVVWLALVLAYCAHAATRSGTLGSDLTHPILSPFLTLVTITPMILAAGGLGPYAPAAATVLTDVLIGLTVLHGAWFTGQLIYAEHTLDQLHPGYFIPTVAGGLLASAAAAQVGQTDLAWVLFGYGTIAWLVVGSIILGRLFFGPRLPAALVLTLAIEVAPGAVASLAWFSLDGGRIDTVARLLAGYGVLMVLAQVRLLPAFLRLRFSGAFWAFAFSWTAVATVGLHWIRETRPAGGDTGAALVLAAATLLVGAIAVRTVVALYRGTLFPRDAVPVPPSFAARTSTTSPARHQESLEPQS
jgi:tellurite resistance protein